MNLPSPLTPGVAFFVGPIPITSPVITTWGVMAVLGVVAFFSTRNLQDANPGRWQVVIEGLVMTMYDQIFAVIKRKPDPFLPMVGTLFIFIITANLTMLIPHVEAPTAYIETPAALAITVYFSAHAYGIYFKGARKYFMDYAKPNIVMLPLNFLAEITRTFSLMVRLFGNIMSHELVVAVVVSLAAFLIPVPFMMLAILISVIQAFIFTILATVFLGAAARATDSGE